MDTVVLFSHNKHDRQHREDDSRTQSDNRVEGGVSSGVS